MTPHIAAAMRQPTGLACPKSFMPRATSHLPVGGWTGYPPTMDSPETSPATKEASYSLGQVPSYPRVRSDQASLT